MGVLICLLDNRRYSELQGIVTPVRCGLPRAVFGQAAAQLRRLTSISQLRRALPARGQRNVELIEVTLLVLAFIFAFFSRFFIVAQIAQDFVPSRHYSFILILYTIILAK